jgi:hypothetical protein
MNREVHNELETLDRDEQAVSRLVAGLEKVEAPANFERRVMAKIAEGRPKRRALFGVPAFAYTVPALLVVLLATFFVFKLRERTPAQPGPETIAANVSSTPSTTENSVPENISIVAPSPEDTAVAKVGDKTSSKPADRRKGGSFDIPESGTSNKGGSFTTGQDQTQLPPPEGIDPNSRSAANRVEVMTPTSISVKEVLDLLGISADVKGQWRVTAVRENSSSAKSGIKAGDILTALDGKDINTLRDFMNSGSISVITVRRDGKLIPIKVTSH